MRKFILLQWIVTVIFLILSLPAGGGQCWAWGAGVFSRVDSWYHTDYVPGGEPYRDKVEDKTYYPDTEVSVEKSGDLREGSYTSEAKASTEYGSHHVRAKVKVTNSHLEIIQAYAYSYFEDDWRVITSTTNTSGKICLGISIFGNLDGDYSQSSLNYKINCYGPGCSSADFDSVDEDSFTQPFQVVYGCFTIRYNQEFKLYSDMEVVAWLGSYEGDYVSGEASLEFLHSAVITSLVLPEGATLLTASETKYPLAYTPPTGSKFPWGMFLPAILDAKRKRK